MNFCDLGNFSTVGTSRNELLVGLDGRAGAPGNGQSCHREG
jgi:hypothetical protein